MIVEKTGFRKRTHRIKTISSHISPQPLILPFGEQLRSTMFKQEFVKIDQNLKKNRDSSHWCFKRHASLARRSNMSLKFQLPQKQFNFTLMDYCNNADLVSKLLQQRSSWNKSNTKTGQLHFIWGYINFQQISKLKGKQVLSRIPGSSQMTNKGKLYQNIDKYCQKKGISMNFLPITFHFDREGPTYLLKDSIKQFLQFFHYVKENTTLNNIWILKPTNMNQGRDIHLFNSLQSLARILSVKSHQNSALFQAEVEQYIRNNRSLIIQKYIQNPLLVNGHKFDVRMWVLVDHLRNYYMFQEGYLRFTSLPYRIDANSIKDNYIHLTNHSLQKHSQNYSKEHNLQPMSILKAYLSNMNQQQSYDKIIYDMKDIVKTTISATLSQQQQKCKKDSFQIFGFDFLIDRELNVRLIEANCNPAITEDCPLLEELIPKMLNDAFKLTIDVIFGTKSTKMHQVNRLSNSNSWTRLGNLC